MLNNNANTAGSQHTVTSPDWAEKQIALRKLFNDWIEAEINVYESEGFEKLFGSQGGHGLDEAGGYTRAFASAYYLSGNKRILLFMKQLRDDWYRAVTNSGHFYHGYAANENGDYITHTAEAYTQFLLNVLYMDIKDDTTVAIIEDAAEHLGNWNPNVQDWYDWDRHVFLSYFLGTRSPYHKPPFNQQTTRHFRVIAIASGAYEATGNQRYLRLCEDYWSRWYSWLKDMSQERFFDNGLSFKVIGKDEIRSYARRSEYMNDWRFHNYYRGELEELGLKPPPKKEKFDPPWKASGFKPRNSPHDLVMTMLDVMRFVPEAGTINEGLRKVMKCWIAQGPDGRSQLAGIDPHCGIHLPKYRDITGDHSLDSMYLDRWIFGPCSYLLAGDPFRLTGVMEKAGAEFAQALLRNRGEFGPEVATDHACDGFSNAGVSSAYVMPALFMPALGGLGVHFGRAPWLKVLYYTDSELGLPPDVAALYMPNRDGAAPGVRLNNRGDTERKIGVSRIDPKSDTRLEPADIQPQNLIQKIVSPGCTVHIELQK